MPLSLRRQTLLFARAADGSSRTVTWTEWEASGRARSEVLVSRVVRTLLPRDRVGHQVESRDLDVPLDALEAWLRARGLTIVGRLDGPLVDEPLPR